MSRITTHILDTSKGRPAAGVDIILFRLAGGQWQQVASGQTNADGRIMEWPDASPGADALSDISITTYKMLFATRPYFEKQSVLSFYPFVEIHFETGTDAHYHIPLLISPFGYSTYRGS